MEYKLELEAETHKLTSYLSRQDEDHPWEDISNQPGGLDGLEEEVEVAAQGIAEEASVYGNIIRKITIKIEK